MFYERQIDIIIDSTRRLKKRLPESHPKYQEVSKQLYNLEAGLGGEQRIDDVLRSISFPTKFAVIPNFRFTMNDYTTQIDILLVTQSYVLVIEVKNWAGTLQFNDYPRHVKQISSSGTSTFGDPLIQAENAATRLSTFLLAYKVNLPIAYVVVFTSSKAIFEMQSVRSNLILANELPLFIKKLNASPTKLSASVFDKFVKSMYALNIPDRFSPLLAKYQLTLADLKMGLYCEVCHGKVERHSQRVYQCIRCGANVLNPIYHAALDWLSIVHPSVTNRQLREFTGINSSKSIINALYNSNLITIGSKKGKKYLKNEDMLLWISENERVKRSKPVQ